MDKKRDWNVSINLKVVGVLVLLGFVSLVAGTILDHYDNMEKYKAAWYIQSFFLCHYVIEHYKE